jgi:flagellar hook-associated protein 2
MSTSTTTAASSTPTFSGQSQFAASLQQVITRAVGIASLPLQTDEVTLNSLDSRHTDLQYLDTDFANIQNSVAAIQTALSSSSLSTSVSDSTVSATVASNASPGSYSIQVENLGSFSTALSNAGSTAVTDPTSQGISSDTSLTLNVGGTLTSITPASTSLDDLATAINTQSDGQVQATVVNVGSTSSPDYRLSLAAGTLGTSSIDLTDSSGTSLIAESNPGSLASYEVAGQTATLTSDTRTVTLAPGLTVNLLSENTSGNPTTVTVSNDPSALASAFSDFAQNYNQAVSDLAQYHGKDGGALEGDSIIGTLTNTLQQLSTYSNGTAASSLANFGITVDDTGVLSIDSATFSSAATTNFANLVSTLGGTSTNGFLFTASNLLNGVEDTTTGSLKLEENTAASEITAQNTTIANEQAKIAQIQTNITAQMVTADAAIASLESQVSYVNGLFYSITGNNNNPNAAAS